MRSHPDNLSRRRTGYTMIELVLVMVVLLLVAGLAAPSMRNFAHGRAAGDAAQEFVAVARWARTQAMSQGAVYRLNVDLSSRTYYVTVQQNGKFDAPGEEFGGKFAFPDGVGVDCDFAQQADGTYVEFDPDGRCDVGNLRLTGSNQNVIQIGCLSSTEPFQIFPPNQQVAWGVHHSAKYIVGGQNP